MSSSATLPLALLALAACHEPPNEVGPPRFEWSVALSELDEAVLAVCAEGDELLAVGGVPGRAFAIAWDGAEWIEQDLPGGSELLWWCWIGEGGVAYAVGENLTILRRDGGAWSREAAPAGASPRTHLFGVWGSGDEVFAVGGAFAPPGDPSLLLARDANGWTRVVDDALPAQVLFKIWGTSPEDMWIVGAGATIVHADRLALTAHAAPTPDNLIAVWGAGSDEVYAVGGDGRGVVHRYDGAGWREYATAPEQLAGVWTTPGAPLYVGGARGFVARFDRATGVAVTAVPLPDVDIHNLAGTADGAIIASGRDLLSNGNPGWRGAVLTHNGARDGDLDRRPPADAGPTTAPDAGTGVGPGPAETCDLDTPPLCAPGLECWQLLRSDAVICTQLCEHELDCRPTYGDDACCSRPGFQTLATVCIPGHYIECSEPE